ncbi:unnamed protein product [Lactuca virosa]|uniref:Uncharacterized protein n=1 Tax=Lactuca virosa TaxID=75947 RepID=A0AAU9PE09_9ASTR|nr:unnamed protein product [Lactuca virosa]
MELTPFCQHQIITNSVEEHGVDFGKAIQVPFISQCPTEYQKLSLPNSETFAYRFTHHQANTCSTSSFKSSERIEKEALLKNVQFQLEILVFSVCMITRRRRKRNMSFVDVVQGKKVEHNDNNGVKVRYVMDLLNENNEIFKCFEVECERKVQQLDSSYLEIACESYDCLKLAACIRWFCRYCFFWSLLATNA